MSAFVTHVSQERPIGLAHRRAPPFPLRIVGFREVHRDDALGVAGQHARFGGILRIGFELEREAVFRIVVAADEGKAEGEQRDDQPPLRNFETVPGLTAVGMRQIRDDARQPAGPAQRDSGSASVTGTAQLHTCSSV